MIHRRNEVMVWDPSAWGGITHTKFDPNMLWTPDIYLIEDVSDEMSGQDKYKTPISCQHTGMQVYILLFLFQNTILNYFLFNEMSTGKAQSR